MANKVIKNKLNQAVPIILAKPNKLGSNKVTTEWLSSGGSKTVPAEQLTGDIILKSKNGILSINDA